MSDWEDNFGAGYSAESMIDSINHSNRMEARQNRRDERRTSLTSSVRTTLGRYTTFGASGTEELIFSTYDEALAWEKGNPGVVFARRRCSDGYVMRIYGDGKIKPW